MKILPMNQNYRDVCHIKSTHIYINGLDIIIETPGSTIIQYSSTTPQSKMTIKLNQELSGTEYYKFHEGIGYTFLKQAYDVKSNANREKSDLKFSCWVFLYSNIPYHRDTFFLVRSASFPLF